MKKRAIALCMAVLLALALTACGDGADKKEDAVKEEKTEKNKTEEEKASDSEKDKPEKADIEVTLPAYFFDEEGMADINEEAKADGVEEAAVNADGSVTYKMNKTAHEKLLAVMKEGIDESITEVLADKENYPSYTEITYNEDVTEFRIMADPASYGGMQSFGALAFYELGNMYQGMNLVPEDQINTAVLFVNKDTQEIIESGDSKSMAEEYQGEE